MMMRSDTQFHTTDTGLHKDLERRFGAGMAEYLMSEIAKADALAQQAAGMRLAA